MRLTRRLLVLALAAVFAAPTAAASAAGDDYAPLDRPGPALSVAPAKLNASLTCFGDLRRGPHEPILLIPATGVDPQEFTWNWMRALRARGWSYCAVTLPGRTTGDIQIAGEYVVSAIRTMRVRSHGRQVQVVGHSQGGMLSRWALRFWPDLRPMVDDLAAMVPSNHGSVLLRGACTPACAPAIWQQKDTSAFVQALNSRAETFAGISYTNVYTHNDEFMQPNQDETGTSSLRGGGGQIANVAIQSICPGDTTDHLGAGTWNNTTFEVVMDALSHPGPANPSRVPTTVCAAPLQPGVVPATYATDTAGSVALLAEGLAGAQQIPAEPALACYTKLVCARGLPGRPAAAPAPAPMRAAPEQPHLPATGPPGALPLLASLVMCLAYAVRRSRGTG